MTSLPEDHVSVVIGGTSGIGRAIAMAFAGRGGTVAVVGRNEGRLDATVAALREAGAARAESFRADASRPEDMDALGAWCRERLGHVDLLAVSIVATTGGDGLPPQVKDLTLADWQNTIDVNLHGIFLSNRAIIPMMVERGSGQVINIGSALSPAGMKGQPHSSAYSASKFAVAAFSQQVAREVEEDGVRVTAILPGAVKTPLIAGSAIDAAFGGSMTPESVATAVLELTGFLHDAKVLDPYFMPMRVRGGGRAGR
ncbi:hypothetical protein DLJ53_00660 [Acuticoccus sediminis]|uniref:NADP-dependent 3-hydroxy acid dehydrogenase YdfG n=1 Tax=Acuticoccus sediminis TaxID=2184697 RepID=A0A8B2NZG2_9HYPH|nr:SDR family oxidoreductase [Acuticoccus sediminis]RAI03084.1 hypothetical protein DLJ53_00660 [Acuticoccus sediminis]